MSILLDVKNLGISFGGLRAVNEFDLTIQKEQLYGLIGPNGAGKTTVFNLLTGVYKPDAGKVILDGKDITGERNIEISKAGIARTFQNIRLFKQLSVLDNVKAGLHNHHPYSTLSGILRLPSYRKVEKEMDDRAMELLKVFDLEKYADHQRHRVRDFTSVFYQKFLHRSPVFRCRFRGRRVPLRFRGASFAHPETVTYITRTSSLRTTTTETCLL